MHLIRHFQGVMSFAVVNAYMAYKFYEKKDVVFRDFQNQVCWDLIARYRSSNIQLGRSRSQSDAPTSRPSTVIAGNSSKRTTHSNNNHSASQARPPQLHECVLYGSNRNGRCEVCKLNRHEKDRFHGYFYCTVCSNNSFGRGKTMWLCGPASGRSCVAIHQNDHLHK